MEMFYSFLSLLLLLSSLVILVRQWRNKNQRLPPGPWRLPLIGSLHHLIGRDVPHRTLRSLAQKYGPLMYLQLGQVPTIIVSSPSIAKQVVKTHDLAFCNRPQSTSTNIIFYNQKDIAFGQYGEYWRQMRKVCTIELLSAKMVKSFGAIRQDELSSLISSIRSMRGSPVNITEKIVQFTNSVTCRAAFGKMFKDRDELIKLIKEVLLLGAGFDVADLFPSWKLLHKLSGAKSRLVNAHQKVDKIMEDILNEHIENKEAGNKGIGEFGGEDLVDIFLRIKENAELQFPITNDHIKAVIFDIFTAGTETSSTTIIWALSEMMKDPNIMAKAQSEVRQVFKGKKSYGEEDLEKLTYLNLVIKETLRLHTPIPLLPRECREQTYIDGYSIPLRTRVLVNAWALGRDPESWHDPENFIPERFQNSSIDYMGNHFEFIPFGAGRRTCPGMLFGLANVGLPLAQLLPHFEWELPYGTNPKDLDMTETHGLSATKRKDLYLAATNHYKEF
ncbi:PREDICTED: premnaspirodiene oxygenase-like [Nicotiana attenuata]|uniref:Cytochrome p450 71d7 n=1 Tax=Nicotiana attenuata TaxID=49451 RepID=A0A314LG31_NICAT|nr:PREDICTED: premnaspirodiene oxygenase-like [Nicotiana attenuata]OIT40690.1 cytochrome p450 71d7 [Nicotiana attenuata]